MGILERLTSMNDALKSLVVSHREEMGELRRTNQHLAAEFQTLRIIIAGKEMSTNETNAIQQKMALFENPDSIPAADSLSDLSLSASCFPLMQQSENEMASQVTQRGRNLPTNFYGESSKVFRNEFRSVPLVPMSQNSFSFSSPPILPPNLLSAVKPKKSIFITHLQPRTRNEDVISYITEKIDIDRNLLQCLKITPKTIANPFFAAFKIDVPEEVFNSVILSKFWPQGVVSREFTDNKRSSNFRLRKTNN